MQSPLTSFRALARLAAVVLVTSMLSVLTAATVRADEPGQPVGKDRSLAGGVQTLTVTVAASDGMGTLNGEVQLFRWDDGGQGFEAGEWITVEEHASSSAVDFEVIPGTYYARYRSWSPDVVSPAYSGGAGTLPLLPTDPGTFEVTAGSDAAASISLTARATLSGSLTYPDGTPVERADVEVYPAGSRPDDAYAYVTTIDDGSFRVPVDPGSWRVVIRTGDEAYLDHTYEDVTVALGRHLTLPSVQLREPARASVSGAVTVQGSPRAGLEVNLIRVTDDGDWVWVTSTSTDSHGEYTLVGVRDDRRYTVRVTGEGISPTLLGGSADPASAVTFTSADGSPLPTIDVLPAARISGVLLGDGSPVKGDVNIYSVSPTGAHVWRAYAYTDDDGTWSLSVPAGDYVIYAHAYDGRYLFTYVGSRTTDDMFGAGSFHVDAGEALTKEIAVLPASVVSGSVVADGSPLAGAYVMAFVWDGARKLWSFASDDHSDQDGAYSLSVRDGDQVTVRVSRAGFLPQFLGGGADFPGTPTAGNSVTATGRTTAVRVFSLVPVVEAIPEPTSTPAPTPTVTPNGKAKVTVTVTGPKTVGANMRAVLAVRVRTVGKRTRSTVSGHVVITMTAQGQVKGKRVLTGRTRLRDGRATFRLPQLSTGTWAIRATYEGGASVKGAEKHVLEVVAPTRATTRKR